MKKLFLLAAFAGTFVACNEPTTETETTDVDTTMNNGMTTVTETTTTTTTYTAAEGDVKRVDGKVMVYQNGAWVAAENDVTLDNDVVVTKKGEVKNNEGEVIVLEEGEAVSKTGRFFDKAGNAIEKGWDATKEGVKDAGKAVGNAAEKAAEKTKDVFDGKDEDKK